MSNQSDDPAIKRIPLKDLHSEPGAEDLLESPAMRPYMNYALTIVRRCKKSLRCPLGWRLL